MPARNCGWKYSDPPGPLLARLVAPTDSVRTPAGRAVEADACGKNGIFAECTSAAAVDYGRDGNIGSGVCAAMPCARLATPLAFTSRPGHLQRRFDCAR